MKKPGRDDRQWKRIAIDEVVRKCLPSRWKITQATEADDIDSNGGDSRQTRGRRKAK